MPEPSPAHQPDTPAISLPQLTLPVRLCDYADCRRPLHKCARASPTTKDCQVCVASHPACALSRPIAQETGKHDQVTRTTMSALHDKALARMLMLAQGCESFRLLLSRGEKVVYYET